MHNLPLFRSGIQSKPKKPSPAHPRQLPSLSIFPLQAQSVAGSCFLLHFLSVIMFDVVSFVWPSRRSCSRTTEAYLNCVAKLSDAHCTPLTPPGGCLQTAPGLACSLPCPSSLTHPTTHILSLLLCSSLQLPPSISQLSSHRYNTTKQPPSGLSFSAKVIWH